ncbi:unnamed protein product [Pleuronectes platessa]|uniref:Uncharacterized protein n=1 Tax=Pleuronectes platessa TaxID=8262 RepID=A0A9N7VCG3_PLEPL|nr:unnamed protein product [Pleuronectes platessa]
MEATNQQANTGGEALVAHVQHFKRLHPVRLPTIASRVWRKSGLHHRVNIEASNHSRSQLWSIKILQYNLYVFGLSAYLGKISKKDPDRRRIRTENLSVSANHCITDRYLNAMVSKREITKPIQIHTDRALLFSKVPKEKFPMRDGSVYLSCYIH